MARVLDESNYVLMASVDLILEFHVVNILCSFKRMLVLCKDHIIEETKQYSTYQSLHLVYHRVNK